MSGIARFGAHLTAASLCLMVFAVPLAYWPDAYDCDLAPKCLVIHACTALACLGWLVRAWGDRSVRPLVPPLLAPLLGFMGVALLSAPGATHPLDTAVELLNLTAWVALFYVAADAFSRGRPEPFLWAGAVSGLIVSLVGILQYHGLAFQDIPSAALPSATFGNRNFAAMYLVCALPLSGVLFLTARRRSARLLSGLSASLMAVFLVYTRTRSAWVGAAAALLTASALLRLSPGLRRPALETLRQGMDRSRKRWASGLAALALVLSFLPPARPASTQKGLPYLPEQKTDILATAASVFRPDEGEERDRSIQSRLAIWGVTLRMVADRPFLGVGPGGWKRAYPPYDRGLTIRPEMSFKNPHNDYLWIAAEYGLAGLAVYVWLLTAAFRNLLRAAKDGKPRARLLVWGAGLALLAALGDACFNFPRARPHAMMYFYLLLGIVAATAGAGEKDKGQSSPLSRWEGGGTGLRNATSRERLGRWPHGSVRLRGGWGLPLLLLLVSLTAAVVSWRRVVFDRHYLRASQRVEDLGDWPGALSETRRAEEEGLFRPHLLVFRGVALQRMNDPAGAEAAYRRSLQYAPQSWQAHANLCALLTRQGRFEEAAVHGRTALSLCPDAVFNRYNLGMAYQGAGRDSLALREFQSVLAAQPDHAAAHLRLAQVYLAQNRFQDALPHALRASRIRPDSPEAHWNLGLALSALGRTEQAEAAYLRTVVLRPEFPPVHLTLGRLRQMQGRYGEALEEYRRYLNLDRSDPAGQVHEWVRACEEQLKLKR